MSWDQINLKTTAAINANAENAANACSVCLIERVMVKLRQMASQLLDVDTNVELRPNVNQTKINLARKIGAALQQPELNARYRATIR